MDNQTCPNCGKPSGDGLEGPIDKQQRELNLYKQALAKAVSLPKGVLPHETGKYFTCLLNGNCVVTREAD